jgi:hypothetical protein
MRMSTFRQHRAVGLLTTAAVLALAGALAGMATAGQSTVSIPRLGSAVTVPADKAAAMANRMPSALTDSTPPGSAVPTPAFTPDPIPAKILGPDVPVPVPASTISATNGWLVSNGYNLVAIYAGTAPDDPTHGRVVIVRQDLRAGKQTLQVVDAGATGSLAVASGAPTGSAVETSALTGAIPLRTSHGKIVNLNLATNIVSG